MRSAEWGIEASAERTQVTLASPDLFATFTQPQGLLTKLYSAFRIPASAFRWVTITMLLAALLITAVAGQKLGWWFAPAKPKTAPAKPDMRPGKIHS